PIQMNSGRGVNDQPETELHAAPPRICRLGTPAKNCRPIKPSVSKEIATHRPLPSSTMRVTARMRDMIVGVIGQRSGCRLAGCPWRELPVCYGPCDELCTTGIRSTIEKAHPCRTTCCFAEYRRGWPAGQWTTYSEDRRRRIRKNRHTILSKRERPRPQDRKT